MSFTRIPPTSGKRVDGRGVRIETGRQESVIAQVRNDDGWCQVVALQMMKSDQILASVGRERRGMLDRFPDVNPSY